METLNKEQIIANNYHECRSGIGGDFGFFSAGFNYGCEYNNQIVADRDKRILELEKEVHRLRWSI